LREVHHRVKNNLAVICSLFSLQSMHTKEERTIQIFQDMENRVHTMALVHESLYSSENLARINFAEYAQSLAGDILASLQSPDAPVRLKADMEPLIMGVDLALPCGLILNELISNACKHGLPKRTGEVKVTLRDVNTSKSLGLGLVRLLAQQIHGSFDVRRSDPGTAARLEFVVGHDAR
jgi:two-component sensor histidine kinase